MRNYKSKLKQWQRINSQLARLKRDELKLRKELCAHILSGTHYPERTKVEVDGFIFTIEQKLIYNIDQAVLSQVWTKLDVTEQSAFKFEPKLVMKMYNEVGSNSLIQEAIITKPATPTIKVKE